MRSRTQSKWQPVLAMLAVLVMLMGNMAGSVSAQDAEPTKDPAQLTDPTLPQETTPEATQQATTPPQPESTPQTTTNTTTRAQVEDPATSPGAPASLAHGLAYYDGDDLVWQVQEVDVPVISEADSAVSDPAIIIQRDGQTIVRNDATGKRALLNPGEAFFITSEDKYTIMSEDDGSVIWKYTLVDPDDVAGDAFYESPALTSVRAGTYDFKLVRYVLQPGDTAELPTNSGAGLVMPGAGEVQVDHGGELSLLGLDGGKGQGQVLRQPTSISNTGSESTVVYYLHLGDSVSDDSSAPANSTSNNTNAQATVTPASGDGDTTETDSEEPADSGSEGSTSPNDQPEGGPYLAQINIYAQQEIYLTVTVDGVVWFDSVLPAGSWTGPMPGSTFEVQTSSGANTLFENACGVQFFMGEEPGDAFYSLVADATSCPPPGQ